MNGGCSYSGFLMLLKIRSPGHKKKERWIRSFPQHCLSFVVLFHKISPHSWKFTPQPRVSLKRWFFSYFIIQAHAKDMNVIKDLIYFCKSSENVERYIN